MVPFVAHKHTSMADVEAMLHLSSREGKFTNNGPVKRLLESELSHKLGISSDKAVVCLGNGTAALHALLFALERREGRKLRWMSPSLTFPTPVVGGFDTDVVRIDPSDPGFSLPLDVSLDNVDGVIITTLFGSTLSVNAWVLRCKQEGKFCILDNASSPASLVDGTSVMEMGDASFSSLHHTKYLGVGEGGFVVVDRDFADDINQAACFGFDADRRFDSRSSNLKMSDFSAAFVLSHVQKYNIELHCEIQEDLSSHVRSLGLNILGSGPGVVHGNLPVLFSRSIEKSELSGLGVEVNKYYRPLSDDPGAWDVFRRTINFPLHTDLSASDIRTIKRAIETVS
jgi:dTDP-4-amino-4,6-dideoxygalactose transaminase